MGADADLRQPIHAVAVNINGRIGSRNALEQAEQQRCTGNIQRFPVAEDHHRQRQEAEACHIAVGGAVGGGQGVDKAAHACQEAGDRGAGIAHFIDIDAQRVSRLRIFTAGPQAQAELRLIQNDRQHHKQDNANIGGDIGFVQEGLTEEAEIGILINAEGGFLNHKPTGGVAGRHLQGVLVGNDAHQEQHQRRCHHVQRRAADRLVGTQVDGREGQQQ